VFVLSIKLEPVINEAVPVGITLFIDWIRSPVNEPVYEPV
jgi:hypothetical protein